jgi:hypothetical protein
MNCVERPVAMFLVYLDGISTLKFDLWEITRDFVLRSIFHFFHWDVSFFLSMLSSRIFFTSLYVVWKATTRSKSTLSYYVRRAFLLVMPWTSSLTLRINLFSPFWREVQAYKATSFSLEPSFLKRGASLRSHNLLFWNFIFEERCKLKRPKPSF